MLIQSFYLNGGFSLKNFDNVDKIEKIIKQTLAHLNINNEDNEKWNFSFNKKTKKFLLFISKMRLRKPTKLTSCLLTKLM